MDVHHLTVGEFTDLVLTGIAHEELAGGIVMFDDQSDDQRIAPLDVRSLPAVVVARDPHPLADVELGDDRLGTVVDALERNPLAGLALVLHMRGHEGRSAADGLVAESAVYSMLQGGPEFAAWRRSYTRAPRISEIGPAVRVERDEDVLHLTLSRPHVHNAFSRRLRDELCDALSLAATDDTINRILLDGAGPSFCSGGDLTEFGSFPDPVSAHVIRLTRSPARLMAAVGRRVEAHLHGACMGAGIELPAFAKRVVAHPDTVFALPEIRLGLIPGAGGTVSIARRIGRHRATWLALTGARIDAATALDWKLVDAIA